mmetsp:Transcript_36626/g.79776  ORF Transcript_36626/g.79776 Transcript_36626/m.79776 type:complete len:273 (+) Transcript_36626:241-1059(+)
MSMLLFRSLSLLVLVPATLNALSFLNFSCFFLVFFCILFLTFSSPSSSLLSLSLSVSIEMWDSSESSEPDSDCESSISLPSESSSRGILSFFMRSFSSSLEWGSNFLRMRSSSLYYLLFVCGSRALSLSIFSFFNKLKNSLTAACTTFLACFLKSVISPIQVDSFSLILVKLPSKSSSLRILGYFLIIALMQNIPVAITSPSFLPVTNLSMTAKTTVLHSSQLQDSLVTSTMQPRIVLNLLEFLLMNSLKKLSRPEIVPEHRVTMRQTTRKL